MARARGGKLAVQRVALGNRVVAGIQGEEILLNEFVLPRHDAFLLGEQRFQAGNFGLFGTMLPGGVGGVEFSQKLPFLHRKPGARLNPDDAPGYFGGDLRVDNGLERAERRFGDLERLRADLGDCDEGGGRCLLFLNRLFRAAGEHCDKGGEQAGAKQPVPGHGSRLSCA